MKKLILITTALMLTNVFAAQAGQEVEMKETVVALSGAFVPGGFDSKSDVYVVVSGIFPNTCYNWQGADIVQEAGAKQVDITAKAMVAQGVPCMRVLVPFQKEVNLGQFPKGDYVLRFSNGDGTFFNEPLQIED